MSRTVRNELGNLAQDTWLRVEVAAGLLVERSLDNPALELVRRHPRLMAGAEEGERLPHHPTITGQSVRGLMAVGMGHAAHAAQLEAFAEASRTTVPAHSIGIVTTFDKATDVQTRWLNFHPTLFFSLSKSAHHSQRRSMAACFLAL
jgi:hypothetical protein